jgi:hypothetical protein
VEGHHVSLHLDVVNGTLVSSTPTFFGSNQPKCRTAEERDADSRGRGGFSPRASDGARRERREGHQHRGAEQIVTTNKLDIAPLSPAGVPASE